MDATEANRTREARLQQARRLVRAIEDGDTRTELKLADSLMQSRGQVAEGELARITRELREALCNVRLSSQLTHYVQRDLPDAQLRLNQVLELTERAANDTLSAVEESMPVARGIGEAVESYREDARRRRRRGNAELSALLERVAGDAEVLRERLSDVLMAQGFQDLTGQIIRRVVELVIELESCLADGLDTDPTDAAHAAPRSRTHGQGPALPGASREQTVSGQQDVDDLLATLGV